MAPLTKRQLNPDSDPCAYACDPWHNPDRFCPLFCIPRCPDFCDVFAEPPPPSPPPPPPPLLHDHHRYLVSPSFIAMFALLASAFVIAVSYVIYSIVTYRGPPTRRQLSTRVSEYDSSTDALNFHPAWYIATVGLQRSIIESIPVRVYNSNDNLVHGTGCAVCLAEFRDGDSLRLLPKCCHPFHVPCIDTWLSSRTTCPVCRATVAVTSTSNDVSVIEVIDGPNSSSSGDAGSENSDTDDAMEEIDERRLMRRAVSMSSLCVEQDDTVAVERSYSCTGKVFSSSRNGFR